MSNIGLIIEEKAADIGNFLVGRLLPFREKEQSDLSFLSIIWDHPT
jgi:hypothetical protein